MPVLSPLRARLPVLCLGQVAARVRWRWRWLRQLLAVLVLIMVWGMLTQAALAQPQRAIAGEKQLKTGLRQAGANGIGASGQATPERYYAEQMPTFRGAGYQAIVAYVQQQLVWPKGAGLVCVEGRIFIRFTVDTAGSLRNVRVVRGLHPLLDAEALRAVRTLSCLQPGREHGRPVAVTMTVPVSFDNK